MTSHQGYQLQRGFDCVFKKPQNTQDNVSYSGFIYAFQITPPCFYHTGRPYHEGQLKVMVAYVCACPCLGWREGAPVKQSSKWDSQFHTQQMPEAVTCRDRWRTLIGSMHCHSAGRTHGGWGDGRRSSAGIGAAVPTQISFVHAMLKKRTLWSLGRCCPGKRLSNHFPQSKLENEQRDVMGKQWDQCVCQLWKIFEIKIHPPAAQRLLESLPLS